MKLSDTDWNNMVKFINGLDFLIIIICTADDLTIIRSMKKPL